ncbi:MAG: hypothetical protein AAF329_13020 [Cyanobacteria bacterium P01_A01_bin.17]
MSDVTQNISTTGSKTLADAAQEIQQLLKQLEQDAQGNSTAEQMLVAAKAVKQIETIPVSNNVPLLL